MGWWSATILGGDEPLDYMGDIVGMVCEKTVPWNGWDSNLPALKDGLEGTDEQRFLDFIITAYTPAIAAQCVAYAHMACGASLPPVLRTLASATCKVVKELSWEKPEERRAYLEQFLEMILNYDDKTPQRPPEEGLLDRLASFYSPED